MTEEDIAGVRNLESSRLPDNEKAALRFASAFVERRQDLGPYFDDLRKHFSDAQIVEIALACATYLGFGTMVVAFGLRTGAACCAEASER